MSKKYIIVPRQFYSNFLRRHGLTTSGFRSCIYCTCDVCQDFSHRCAENSITPLAYMCFSHMVDCGLHVSVGTLSSKCWQVPVSPNCAQLGAITSDILGSSYVFAGRVNLLFCLTDYQNKKKNPLDLFPNGILENFYRKSALQDNTVILKTPWLRFNNQGQEIFHNGLFFFILFW